MKKIRDGKLLEKLQTHLTEQTLIDYLLQQINSPALHFVSLHLVECDLCAKHFAAMLTFAIQNGMLDSFQTSMVEDFINSEAFQAFQNNSINKILSWYESRQHPGS